MLWIQVPPSKLRRNLACESERSEEEEEQRSERSEERSEESSQDGSVDESELSEEEQIAAICADIRESLSATEYLANNAADLRRHWDSAFAQAFCCGQDPRMAAVQTK